MIREWSPSGQTDSAIGTQAYRGCNLPNAMGTKMTGLERSALWALWAAAILLLVPLTRLGGLIALTALWTAAMGILMPERLQLPPRRDRNVSLGLGGLKDIEP